MVPDSFHDFFIAEAGASGALVGLLFVAISVAPERLAASQILDQARASSALSALVTPLILALVGLLPGAQLGIAAIIVSVAGLLFVAATLRRFFSVPKQNRESPRGLVSLAGFTVAILVILGYGIVSLVQPQYSGAITAIASATIASLLFGVDRAWALIGGRDRGRAMAIVDLVKGEDEGSGNP